MKGLSKNLVTRRYVHTCIALLQAVPKNLGGKTHSSQLWITRQINDPYVELAKIEKYRCRSAFKLLEINERFNILKPGHVVIDCGAAPGSWTQVVVKAVNADRAKEGEVGTVIAIDKQPIYPIEGAMIWAHMDFTLAASQEKVRKQLEGNKADVVLSDMAPNACGVKELDHDNIIQLVYAALKFALQVTKVGGVFVAKVWDGGKSQQLEMDLLRFYKSVKNIRPKATRTESTEKFLMAKDFKGIKSISNNMV